jgi:hypothetical protein
VTPTTSETTLFRREWNLAVALVAIVAGLLFATGYTVGGLIALMLCVAAVVARWSAMRKANRGFYGQDKHPS